MEKISIARRRLEKQKFPFSINPNFNLHTINSNTIESNNNTIKSTKKPTTLKVTSNSLVSLITEEVKLLQTGKRQFTVEIVSGLENPLKMVVSVQSFNSTSGKNENFLTTKEAAQHLRVSKNTIYRQLRSGNLHGQKIGRQWRVLLSTLNSTEKYERGNVKCITNTGE